jgi:hypothetical protein|tara:strand:- start:1750 stop:2019 length:270 start_codon:yes stop_codon:yes gene_type:complete
MMTQELETYFNNYFAMFRSEGWKQLISDFKNNVVSINSVELTEDANNLYFRKGQLAVIANILNLEVQIDNAHQQAQEEKDQPDQSELDV